MCADLAVKVEETVREDSSFARWERHPAGRTPEPKCPPRPLCAASSPVTRSPEPKSEAPKRRLNMQQQQQQPRGGERDFIKAAHDNTALSLQDEHPASAGRATARLRSGIRGGLEWSG